TMFCTKEAEFHFQVKSAILPQNANSLKNDGLIRHCFQYGQLSIKASRATKGTARDREEG
ncbi:hypothetical protein Q7I15_14755, partial [Aeromonas veronii]|uniref:hypothetical protein n=1 Tax=Aeromonas veronii TaxID=654 RepID=UPI003004A17A